jgi:Pro-kumamolisin, activation domain/Putative binding domain, N-terminal
VVVALALYLSPLAISQEVRITRRIDTNERVVLVRSVHPQALEGVDEGRVPDEHILHGMVLEFGRTPQQQIALDQLLAAQQDRGSPDYHQWLTPEQFGERFGAAQSDVTAVRLWLESEGFQVEEIARSSTYIRFSGTAIQVKRSFSAEIHSFSVRGEKHFAPASSVAIPSAIAPLVREVRNLDSFHPQAPRPVTKPLFANGNGTPTLAPGDLATIYDFQSLRTAGFDGTGQTVVVVGQTDINLSDLALYRSSFGLPSASIRIVTVGQDPGISSNDVMEANLDLDVVSAVAPNAALVFVNAANVLDAVQYAIDNHLAPVVSMSYGVCEPLISATPITAANILQSWAQQANAEGMTWVASSGDSGAAGCDPFGAAAQPATHGLAVSLPASIPEVSGVGGTGFQPGTASYWATNNGANGGSAISYVPEVAWNDDSSTDPGASGGGASIDFPKPLWQSGPGVPDDNARDVPDVAFAASPSYAGYIIALNGQLSISDPSGAYVVGGTSGATPLFAGVLGLLNQYLSPFQPAQPGQGNINPTLYSLAQTTTDVFHDVTQGNNLWLCQPSFPDCLGTSLGYQAGPGYDQVTGLGSVDANNLLHEWPGSRGQSPTVTTGQAAVTASPSYNAALTGTVTANGSDTHCYFLFGTSPNLTGSSQTSSIDAGSGAVSLAVTANATGLTANTTYYFQMVATNATGTSSGSILTFTTTSTGQIPSVAAALATQVTASSATVGGTVNPNGLDTHYAILYGASSSLSVANQTTLLDAGSGSIALPVTANITGLLGNTIYYFRLIASNTAGTALSPIVSFTTNSAGQLPVATALPASAINSSGATLGGAVNPNGRDTHYWFSYGTNSALSASVSTAGVDAGSGTSVTPAAAVITGLASNTIYYFQLHASNSAGTTNSSILSFTTTSSGQPPTVSTGIASSVTTNTAVLSGTVTPNGVDTHYWFLYSDGTNVFETPTYDAGSGNQQVSISVPIIGLYPNTAYAFKIVASNSAGVNNGSTNNFLTNASGQIPYVVVGGASVISTTSVTISGTVNPDGSDTHYWFQYGTSPSLAFANQTSIIDAGSGSSPLPVAATLTGLSNGTYYYRLQASNSAGTAIGNIAVFIMNKPPTAVTLPASVSGETADLNAQLNDNGDETHYWFLYGTSPTLAGATKTPVWDAGSTVFMYTPFARVTGLLTATTYYFQFQASNGSGTSSGAILSFKTNLPLPHTDFAANTAPGSWTLNGDVVPYSLDTHYWFLWGTSPTLSGASQTPTMDAGAGTSFIPIPISAPVTELSPNVTYYFQLVTSNAAGTVEGSILSFFNQVDSAPTVTLAPATVLSGGAATLSGTVNPNALATWYYFVYGTDSTFPFASSQQTGAGNTPAGQGVPVSVNASLTGLTTGLTYYYQLVAWNTDGTTFSPILSFTESADCFSSLPNNSSIFLSGDAASSSFQINGAEPGCSGAAASDQNWLTLSNNSTGGSWTLNYAVTQNNSGTARTAHITVGAQQLTITQKFTSAEFADVPPSAGYFDAANLMFEKGVTVGCTGGSTPQTRSYCPDSTVTRGQMAAFIVRAVTGTTTPVLYNPIPYFADVPSTDPFFSDIQKLMELGITVGCATGPPALYCPNDPIPRWQMAIFMVRARLALYGASFSANPMPYFADAPVNVDGGGAFQFIQRAYEEHITAGCGTNPLIYCPDQLVTRGQMASFIMRGLFNETTSQGPAAPQVTGVSPNTMAQTVGTQITVTISGVNTSFQSGDTATVPSGMLDVSNVVVNSATSMSATLTTNGLTVAGPQSLVVTSGGLTLTLPLAIRVGTY